MDIMATTKKNPFGKSRKTETPYATYRSRDGSWEWRILKTWKRPDTEASDEYARWFVAAKSPHTFGSFELGDEYCNRNDFSPGIRNIGILVSCTREWFEHYGRDARMQRVHITDDKVA